MKEYMYSLWDDEAEITELWSGAAVVRYEDGRKVFGSFDAAVDFLERMGYRF